MTRRVITHFAWFALATPGLLAGCRDGNQTVVRRYVEPSAEALRAVVALQRQHPSARVYFSRTSGDPLWIDGGGASLARGRLDTSGGALKAVLDFVGRHPGLLRVERPEQSLQASPLTLNPHGTANGLVTLRFWQTRDGAPLEGYHGVAFFDPRGNLKALQTRVLPTPGFVADPDQEKAMGTLPQALRSGAAPGSGSRPLDRLVWKRKGRDGVFRMVREQVERDGIRVKRVIRDLGTGQTLESRDETPTALVKSDTSWFEGATPVRAAARDERGERLSIPSSAGADGLLYLGFELEGVLASQERVTLNDSSRLVNRAAVHSVPLATTEADWESEPEYEPRLRSATRLALHLETTLRWFHDELGHSSWNGRGASFHAGINGRSAGEPEPELNAWGGGGMILVGDGVSETGQTLSEALDIVAHEFAHSVLTATTDFEYHDEPGALAESLCDVLGKSVEGFADTAVGTGAGVRFRDVLDPALCESGTDESCAQPDRYGDYEELASDHDLGGVHLNSGIMNRALSLAVLGSARARTPLAAGVGIPPADPVAFARLLLGALKEVSFDPATTLEGFAAGLSAYCLERERAGTLESGQAGLCGNLGKAFGETELLGEEY